MSIPNFPCPTQISFACHIRNSKEDEEEEYENITFCGIIKGGQY